MKHAWKKGLSLLLALLLVMHLFPMAATAQGSGAAPIAVNAAGENTELLTTPLDGAGDVQIDPNAEVTFLVELETAPLITYLNPASDGTRGRMFTGWAWIPNEQNVLVCYYFNPVSDGYRGRLITNAAVDGYTVDAQGRWTINGTVQTR